MSKVNSNIQMPKPQRRKFPAWVLVIFLIVVFLSFPFFMADYVLKRAGISNYWDIPKSFLFAKDSQIKSEGGRVNILILGKGGVGHEGPDLTDSMILASISLTNHSVSLISIPRDIWIPEIRAKINSAYYWGNQEPALGGGFNFAKQTVTEVTGQPVDYALVLDFSGFKDIIDTVGGIDVNVQNSFTDSKYPIAGKENDLCGGDPTFACRYETIRFDQGLTHMDGETALKFVRSRNGDNNEDTDFARDARQQRVISALSNKIFSPQVLLNPGKDYKILKAVKDSTETDITGMVGGILARALLNSRNNMRSFVLPEELLLSPPLSQAYDNQYVLIPKTGSGDWTEIISWVSGVIKD